MQKMQVRSLGREDPLEKEMTAHSSIPAWKIPWTEEPGGLSPRGHEESDTTEVTELTGDLCICSSVNEHLDCVQCLAIMDNAAANAQV